MSLPQRQGTDLRPWRGDQDREKADIVETLIDEAMRSQSPCPPETACPRSASASHGQGRRHRLQLDAARVGSVRVLSRGDLPAAIRLLSANPIENVFVASRVRAAGLEQASLGCPVWGYERGGLLRAMRAMPGPIWCPSMPMRMHLRLGRSSPVWNVCAHRSSAPPTLRWNCGTDWPSAGARWSEVRRAAAPARARDKFAASHPDRSTGAPGHRRS